LPVRFLKGAWQPFRKKRQKENEIETPIVVALIAAAVSLFVLLATHQLSKWRESSSRHAAACSKFRATVLDAVSEIPVAPEHWSNAVLSTIPGVCKTIEVAVREFRPFLRKERAIHLDAEWNALKEHCEEKIPKALSPAELMYGGGSAVARKAKEQVHAHIQNLLSLAAET